MQTLATQVLIGQAREGDRGAVEELCTRYQRRVLAAVRVRLGADLRRKIESMDIVQQVMMEAVGKLGELDFRTEGAFLKYLNCMVENRIRDEAARQHAQRRDARRECSLDAPRSPGDETPLINLSGNSARTPSKVLMMREDLARLEQALDRLKAESPDYCQLIVAVQLEGQTYGELAAEHGTSADAIRMRLKRAMAALTRVYQQEL